MKVLRPFTLLLLFVAFPPPSFHARTLEDAPEWTWKDASGAVRGVGELKKIIEEHRLWLESDGKSGTRAEMGGADLSGASLSGVNLSRALLPGINLAGADLSYSNLSGALMSTANLEGANLFKSDLSNAMLAPERVTLDCANLSYAHLGEANLSGADLRDAIMVRANLRNAQLQDADLEFVNLELANFEPKSLPLLRGIAAAYNLDSITYAQNPDALFQLRKQFQDSGFRRQEREITYALKIRETALLCPRDIDHDNYWGIPQEPNCAHGLFNKIFFDLTCQYGLNYWRPIKILFWLWALCSLIYFVLMHRRGSSGLYVIPSGHHTPEGISRLRSIQRITSDSIGIIRSKRFKGLLRRERSVLCASMMFSARSAFNIGFREFNFGQWLRSLSKREYDIRAVGWARTIAGVQSLISLYMIALWVLTYFGRPFD